MQTKAAEDFNALKK